MFICFLSVFVSVEVSDACVSVLSIVVFFSALILGGFSGLVVSMLVPKIAGSPPAEAVGFFLAKKSSACLPSEGK
jgi:hypothetical protein